MKLHTDVLLVGAYLPLVFASVYPTQPIQATVWTADKPVLVSWIEDWRYPPLSDIGSLDIALWSDADTYLAQLASGVDPMAKTRWVTVPGWAVRSGSKYTLRFTSSRPLDFVVYTADFVIVPGNATTGSTSGTGDPAVALAMQSGTSAGNRTAGTDTGTSTGTASAGTTGSGFTTTPMTAGSTSAPTPTTNAITLKTTTTPSATTGVQRAANAGRGGAMDVEKLKFRFVFVIWPVVMGIAMAL